jgi:hypothetical protein
MIIDTVDLDNLGDSAEEAFVTFDERLRSVLKIAQNEDRNVHSDRDGNYFGSYGPERHYVTSILAFMDEYNLDLEIADISALPDNAFSKAFNEFFNRINYARTRFKLRKNRVDTGQAGTLVTIDKNYKDEIYKCLDTIRKIVNSNITDENKKDNIYKKIASLQSEIDRDRTTIYAFFGRIVDLSKTLGDAAENLEPAIQKIERIMAAFYKGTKRIELLPKPDRPKLISHEGNNNLPHVKKAAELDDEIPF